MKDSKTVTVSKRDLKNVIRLLDAIDTDILGIDQPDSYIDSFFRLVKSAGFVYDNGKLCTVEVA